MVFYTQRGQPMKKPKFVFCNVLLFSLIVFVPKSILANDDNPLKDASFELQLPPDQGGWNLFDQSRYSSSQARSGSQSMFNWGFSRTIPSPPFLLGTVSGSYQEFPASPGSQWQLTGYGLMPNALKGTLAFGIVQVSFFDNQGKDLGTVETSDKKTPLAKTSNRVYKQKPVGEWIFLDTGVATAPENTANIQAFTLYVDYSGSNISQGVYFDDLRLCALDADESKGSACK